MIRNIVFDIGNVLAAFAWKEYIRDTLGYSGETAERVARATTLSPYWQELDRGVMSVNSIIEAMITIDPEIEDQIRHFFEDRRELVREYDYAEKWLGELKSRGYNVYILSNFSEDQFKYIYSNFRFFGHEDGKVISYEEKLLKPDPAIYRILLDRYGLVPDETVFLDDTVKNIEGAKKVGLHGIVFRDYSQGREELENMLKEK